MVKKRTLNVGVVGLGIGRWHCQGYKEYDRSELVALCDSHADLLVRLAKDIGVPPENCYTDHRVMIADAKRLGLDAISIAIPNKYHAPVAIDGLTGGLHVLCEKPMAMTADEGRKMAAAAKKARKTLMVNFSSRFTWEAFAMKRAIEAGELGDIYFARSVWHRRRGIPIWSEWFVTKKLSGGGPIIDFGVHRLDLAMWLMGNPKPLTVSGSTYRIFGPGIAKKQGKKYDVEDLGAAFVRFDNGATLVLEASWAANIQMGDEIATHLYGDKAGLVYRNLPEAPWSEAMLFGETKGTAWDKRLVSSSDPTPTSFQEFVDACLEKREPIATAEQGVAVQVILDAIYKSAATGKEVRMAPSKVKKK